MLGTHGASPGLLPFCSRAFLSHCHQDSNLEPYPRLSQLEVDFAFLGWWPSWSVWYGPECTGLCCFCCTHWSLLCHDLRMCRASMTGNWSTLVKTQTKTGRSYYKGAGFLGCKHVLISFCLALPRSGLRHVHTGSEVQVSPHSTSFQFGKIEEIGDLGSSPAETHLFH
jgi:hypothetical protein